MTLQDILNAVDALSWEDLERLQQRINTRRQHQPAATTPQSVMDEINDLLQHAEPVELVVGTVDMDVLNVALAEIRKGISPEEFAEIERAMNEEYIEPLDTSA